MGYDGEYYNTPTPATKGVYDGVIDKNGKFHYNNDIDAAGTRITNKYQREYDDLLKNSKKAVNKALDEAKFTTQFNSEEAKRAAQREQRRIEGEALDTARNAERQAAQNAIKNTSKTSNSFLKNHGGKVAYNHYKKKNKK